MLPLAPPNPTHRKRHLCLTIACAIVVGGMGCHNVSTGGAKSAAANIAQGAKPTSVQTDHLHNVYQLTPRLYSGSAPESEEAFQELKRLGVKTLISVDGSKPYLDEARAHGMRYIHLPIGYDGVPSERQVALIQAYQTTTGAVFLHCHHGKHRGPAAAAVICEGAAGWSPTQALDWMQRAGTGKEYKGLYASASNFVTPTPVQLKTKLPLPELAPTSSLIDAMVAIDTTMDELKRLRQSSWTSPASQGRSPADAALLMWEHWKELRRLPGVGSKPEDFLTQLDISEKRSLQLLQTLKETPVNPERSNAEFDALARACTDCHRQFRN